MSARSHRKRSQPARSGGWVRLRPRVWAALFMLAALGLAGHFLWRQHAAEIARHRQYQLTAEAVHITPPPPWIRSDVKGEVLHDAGLIGSLSLLEDWDEFVRRVRQAFEFHPWVASVRRIERRLPSAVEVELEYRRPIAVVESSGPEGVAFLPVDVLATRLPDADLTLTERRYLPRISGVAGRPLVGDVWEDARVVGGAKLAAALADVWHRLQLVEMFPSPHPQVQGDARYHSFKIITSGGTRIIWGTAPGEEELAGESPFDAKRQRLLSYVADGGRLDEIDGPATVDVRRKLIVTPRTAERKQRKEEETEVR